MEYFTSEKNTSCICLSCNGTFPLFSKTSTSYCYFNCLSTLHTRTHTHTHTHLFFSFCIFRFEFFKEIFLVFHLPPFIIDFLAFFFASFHLIWCVFCVFYSPPSAIILLLASTQRHSEQIENIQVYFCSRSTLITSSFSSFQHQLLSLLFSSISTQHAKVNVQKDEYKWIQMEIANKHTQRMRMERRT